MSFENSEKSPFVQFARAALLVGAVCATLSICGAAFADDDDDEGDGDVNKSMMLPGAQVAPTSNIDLRNWKLTLPISKNGTKDGKAVEATDLLDFQLPPYFVVTSSSLTFTAPTDGARTSGSHYPRSELREMDGNGDEAEWTVSTGGQLSATLSVNEVPTRTNGTGGPKAGRIVIGQIHGPDDELCRLYYDNGVIYFIDDKAGSSKKETKFLLKSVSGAQTSIPLGKTFSYSIDANAQRLQVTVSYGGGAYTASDPISAFWPGKKLYFKAGAYVQVGTSGTGALETGKGRGSVTFTSLSSPRH